MTNTVSIHNIRKKVYINVVYIHILSLLIVLFFLKLIAHFLYLYTFIYTSPSTLGRTLSIVVPPTRQPVKRIVPTGGVIVPIDKLKQSKIPK